VLVLTLACPPGRWGTPPLPHPPLLHSRWNEASSFKAERKSTQVNSPRNNGRVLAFAGSAPGSNTGMTRQVPFSSASLCATYISTACHVPWPCEPSRPCTLLIAPSLTRASWKTLSPGAPRPTVLHRPGTQVTGVRGHGLEVLGCIIIVAKADTCNSLTVGAYPCGRGLACRERMWSPSSPDDGRRPSPSCPPTARLASL